MLAFGREPQQRELAASLTFISRQEEYHAKQSDVLRARGADPAEVASPPKAALVDFCHSLFNLNEFAYVN